MRKRVLKNIIMIGIIFTLTLILTTVSNAALNITPSKKTVAPGESFNITISVSSDEAGAISISASNATLSNTYVDLMTQSSVTVTCVAGNSGTISLSASGKVANYATETENVQNASNSVTIKQPEPQPTTPSTPANNNTQTTSKPNTSTSTSKPSSNTQKPSNNTTTSKPTKSNNSKLSSIKIEEVPLAQEFSSSVTEYTINVPNEITKLTIEAIPDSSKATVKISGNEELQIGNNEVLIVVTAEDGSSKTYKINTIRADEELALQSLIVYYLNENGEKVDLKLSPIFNSVGYEYTLLEKIPYTVNEVKLEAIANKEKAELEILGNGELKAGKNEITVKVTIKKDDGLEEQKTYKITVEKEEEPVPVAPLSFIDKVGNWFKGAGATVSRFVSENLNKIISAMLIVATTTFVGLTIYFAYDYKNYQKLIAKLAEYNKENLMERANIALNPENATEKVVENDLEEIKTTETLNNQEIIEEKTKTKIEKGKRFK